MFAKSSKKMITDVVYTDVKREKVWSIDTNHCSELKTECFTPYNIKQVDNHNNNELSAIHMWCHNKDSEACLVHIMNYPAHVRYILPEFDENDEKICWNEGLVTQLVNAITKYSKWDVFQKDKDYILSGPMSYKVDQLKSLYGVNAKNETVLTLHYPNIESSKIGKIYGNKVKDIGGYSMKLTRIENKVSDVRRLMTQINVEFGQWFEGSCMELYENNLDKISTQREFVIDYRTIKPIDHNLSSDWIIKPTVMIIDLETYSTNKKAFPKAQNIGDEIYMNSVVFGRIGCGEPKKYCIITCDTDDTSLGEIIRVKDESELICKTFELIKELNPDIIGGYNTFRFDNPYMADRAKILGVAYTPEYKIASKATRLKNKDFGFVDIEWESSGYGDNKIFFPDLDGRIMFDLLPNVKKLFKYKMYTLDFVSNKLLGVGKNDVTALEMFDAFDAVREEMPGAKEMMKRVVDYCIIDSVRPYQIFEKIALWYNWKEMSNTAGVNIIDLFTRGEQIRCYSLICHEAHTKGYYVPDRTTFEGKYKGATVQEPKAGFWENLITLDFSSLYPSIMRAYNLCYTTFVPKEYWHKYKDEDVYIIKFDQEEPADGSDFQKEEEEDEEEEEEEKPKKRAKKVVEMKLVHYEYRFVKQHIKQGIIPDIETRCVTDRKKVKKLMEEVGLLIKEYEKELKSEETSQERRDEINALMPDLRIKHQTLNKKQNAIKVTANSLYGFTGAIETGMLPFLPIALSITAMGRELIQKANDFVVENFNGEVIYGDTDSGMYRIPGIKTREECCKLGFQIEKEINKIFLNPIKMEFEKAADMLIMKKKCYYMLMFNMDGTPETENGKPLLTAKGVATARRDKAGILTTLYQQVVDSIMLGGNIVKSVNFIFDACVNLLMGETPVSQLAVVRELKKIESGPLMHLYKYMKENGREPQKGERIEYIIVNNGDRKGKKGLKMREFEMWSNLKEDEREQPDMAHYISALEKSIDLLFGTGYINMKHKFDDIGYQPIWKGKGKKKEKRMMTRGIVYMIKEIVQDILYEDEELIVKHFGVPMDGLTRDEYAAVVLDGMKEDIISQLE